MNVLIVVLACVGLGFAIYSLREANKAVRCADRAKELAAKMGMT